MAGWHHWLNGRESEWTPGDGDGQGGLVCCDSWGCKESDTTELNWSNLADLALHLCIRKRKKESEVAQSCPTLCEPMDCSLQRSSVHEIFQARVLEWVAISFSFLYKDGVPSLLSCFSSVQSCPTLCNPMNCSLPGSSVHEIFQARVLEWAAISYSTGFSQPRDQTQVSCIADSHFTVWATREASNP